jgi:hypothetical protein
MALPQTPDTAIRQLATPLARLGDGAFVLGLLALVMSWTALAPGGWSLPALLLIASGFTIATIGRLESRGAAADAVVAALGGSSDSELMQFRAEMMEEPRHPALRFWAGVGPVPASRCRWRLTHALCEGYTEGLRRELLCSCNCHQQDALGLTGRDYATLWLMNGERFIRARRRLARAVEASE